MTKTKKPLKIGLIGCGKVARKHHLPALGSLREAEVVALADNDPKTLNLTADAFHIKKRYVNYLDLLGDRAVEAVGVCVPLQLHFEVALAAIGAGKHLLLEKPLAMSLDEADRLIEKASNTDRKILVGFNNRWHRFTRRAREMIAAGLLGPVKLITVIHAAGNDFNAIPDWRLQRGIGGGNLIENGSHFYDLWRFLLQTEIEEVWATSRSAEECDDEPSLISARTQDGVFLNCVLSDFLPARNDIEIFGRKAVLCITLHRFDGFEVVPLYGCAGDLLHRFGNMGRFLTELPYGIRSLFHGGGYKCSFTAEWKHFIEAIRTDTAVECTLEDGRRALQICLAALKSASVRKPVKVTDAPRNIWPAVSA